jgi:hypothetical protein
LIVEIVAADLVCRRRTHPAPRCSHRHCCLDAQAHARHCDQQTRACVHARARTHTHTHTHTHNSLSHTHTARAYTHAHIFTKPCSNTTLNPHTAPGDSAGPRTVSWRYQGVCARDLPQRPAVIRPASLLLP